MSTGLISGYHKEEAEIDQVRLELTTPAPHEATAHMKQLCRQGFVQLPIASQIDDFMQIWSRADTQRRLRQFVKSTSR